MMSPNSGHIWCSLCECACIFKLHTILELLTADELWPLKEDDNRWTSAKMSY